MDSLLPSIFPPSTNTFGERRRTRHTVAARVARLGVWRATALLTAASALVSMALTCLWLYLAGAQSIGDALYITLFVAVPISAVAGGLSIALVVNLEDMRRRLHELATSDPLTGLCNRRCFIHAAQRELDLAQRHDLPLALLLLDIDRFKDINDTHGHAAGDRVLVEVGERCKSVLRTTDLVARWGGEEFVVLLPNTPLAMAQQSGERLRAAVATALHGVNAPAPLPAVTVSIGVAGRAVGTPPPTTLDALLLAADRAMYAAKRDGRDRVHMSP